MAPRSAEPIRVLHLGDDPETTDGAASSLEAERDRLSVVTETTGADGLAALADDVDCVICDVEPRGMDGSGFIDRIREDHPVLPCIVQGDPHDRFDRGMADRSGIIEYFSGESGDPQYAVLANRIENLVELHRASTRSTDRDDRLQALLDGSYDVALIVDEDGTISFASPAVDPVLGYRSDELVGNPLGEYVHPEDRADVRSMLDRSERSGSGASGPVEYRFRAADGGWRWVESTGNDHRTNPAVEGIVVNTREIAERKERERELERYGAIMEAVPLGIFLVDGPPMTGTKTLVLELLAAGHRRGDGAVIVTTDDSVGDIVDRYRTDVGEIDPDRLRLVDCWSRESDGAVPTDVPVEGTGTPDELSASGRCIMRSLSDLQSDGLDDVRVAFLSITTVLAFVSSKEAFQFVHVLTSSLEDRGCLGVFAMDSTVHDERTVNMLRRPFDGMIEIRERDAGKRECRIRGLTERPTEWTSF